MNSQSARPLRTDLGRGLAVGLALVALGLASQASAVEIHSDSGALTGSWDTTLSLDQGWRVKSPDTQLIGIPEGGTARNVNADNGDLNFQTGKLFTQALKVTTELSLKYDNFGLFARGSGLYDYVVSDKDTARTPISNDAKGLAGHYTRLLDAFVFGKWQLGEGHPLEVRLGNQVINWGEASFIASGLQQVNAFDLAVLHLPGTEIKTAFWAQPMIRVTAGLSQNVSAEAFYMFDWRRTELEGVGTYFSTADPVGRGGSQNFIGFGAFSDQGTDFRPLGGQYISNFYVAPRAPDVTPKKSGQGGLALRFFGGGTEFALYAMQYASRIPVVSSRGGTPAGIGNAVAAATTVAASAYGLAAGLTPAAAVQVATGAGLAAAQKAGGDITAQTLASYATIGVNTVLTGGNINQQAGQLANHEYIETTQYFAEYPDKLQVVAASFNTQIGKTGIALQGELDWRHNTPLQYDPSENVFATGTPVEPALLALQGLAIPATCPGGFATLTRCNQLGVFGPDQYIQGWGRYDVWQYQMTAIKSFPPMLGAKELDLVVEAGVTYISNLPNKTSGGPNGQGLRLAGPGLSLSGNAQVAGSVSGTTLAGGVAGGVEPLDRFATQTSWGYVALAQIQYPSLIGSWNFNPHAFWQQDVKGTSPVGGSFLEGRHALAIGFAADLQSRWEIDVNYATFGGGNKYNLLKDRDFVEATFKYSF